MNKVCLFDLMTATLDHVMPKGRSRDSCSHRSGRIEAVSCPKMLPFTGWKSEINTCDFRSRDAEG
jgi:hypothetical protein